MPGDGVGKAVEGVVCALDQPLKHPVALRLRDPHAGACQLDHSGEVSGVQLLVRALPQFIQDLGEPGFVHSGLYRILHLHNESLVIGRQRFLGVDQQVFIRAADPSNVVAAGACLIDCHAVGTDQTVDQGLDAYRALARLAVGDNHAGLYDVAGNHLVGEPGIDHLDIHVIIREIAAFKDGVRHRLKNGQGDLGNVDVVNTPVAIAEKGPGPSVNGADHPMLWPLLEPGIDVLGQKPDVLLTHPVIILPGDVQVGAHLPVGGGQDVQRFHPVRTRLVQKPQDGDAVAGFHVQIFRVHQIVRLGLVLTHDLRSCLLNRHSLLHVDTSLSFTTSRRCSRSAPQPPVRPAPTASPAQAKAPWPANRTARPA